MDPNDDEKDMLVKLPEETVTDADDQEPSPEEKAAAGRTSEASDDDELDDYSDKVKKRINQLTERYHREKRDREEAERLAKVLLEDNKKLKTRTKTLDTGYLTEYENRLKAQEEAAKRALKEAYDAGDTDRLAEAQETIARLSIDRERHRIAKERQARQAEEQDDDPVARARAQQPQQPNPDPKAQAWANKNEWFGEDEEMTAMALGVHQRLVRSGIDPQSDEYYDELNNAIRRRFPEKFGADEPAAAPRVASGAKSASRAAPTGRKDGRVKLSASQVAMARRLNVPLEQYAAEFVKLEKGR